MDLTCFYFHIVTHTLFMGTRNLMMNLGLSSFYQRNQTLRFVPGPKRIPGLGIELSEGPGTTRVGPEALNVANVYT